MAKLEISISKAGQAHAAGCACKNCKPDKSAGNPTNAWKPPSHGERMKMAAEDAAVSSMRQWVSGDISTTKHRANMRRAKKGIREHS